VACYWLPAEGADFAEAAPICQRKQPKGSRSRLALWNLEESAELPSGQNHSGGMQVEDSTHKAESDSDADARDGNDEEEALDGVHDQEPVDELEEDNQEGFKIG
jgi:hypothetical protein